MVFVQALPFAKARETVVSVVGAGATERPVERVPLQASAGRVLASDIVADRAYPPLPRSIRDGFAVHAADFPGSVRVVGEVRAGETFSSVVGPGEAVEIMTGAPVPEGADAIIMVERVVRSGEQITTDRPVGAGDFIVPPGVECRQGGVALRRGTRIDFGRMAALATVGAAHVDVVRQPCVSIIATGDELVAVEGAPAAYQIRNSNTHTLAAQVERAGGLP